jgi:hypothetical protein
VINLVFYCFPPPNFAAHISAIGLRQKCPIKFGLINKCAIIVVTFASATMFICFGIVIFKKAVLCYKFRSLYSEQYTLSFKCLECLSLNTERMEKFL